MIDKSDGFSLLEMLVAISIFSVMSLAVFFTMDQYFTTGEVLNRRNEQFTAMNRFLQMIERDLQYAVNRRIRGPYGDELAAIVVGPVQDNEMLSFTSSLPDYRNKGHSKLFRVSWGFYDGVVTRSYWEVLDQAQDSEPIRHEVLMGVRDLQLTLKPELESWEQTDNTTGNHTVELAITPENGPGINRKIRLSGEF